MKQEALSSLVRIQVDGPDLMEYNPTESIINWLNSGKGTRHIMGHICRAPKFYTSARIYEWKFGKGEWKLPFASPTGRVDFFGFVIIFEEKKNEQACFTACKSNANTVKENRSVGLKCH